MRTSHSLRRPGRLLSVRLAGVAGLLIACLGASPAFAQNDLGTVNLGRSVTADGQRLAAGTYQVRVTAQQAQPNAAGAAPDRERWVEFLQDGQVKGREVASIVPDSELGEVVDGPRPAPGTARVEILKGNEYLRIWINRDGNNYLLHLPVGPVRK